MRRLFISAAALLVCATARSAPDEHVVREMLKQTSGLDAEEIRRNYDACDSGNNLSMKLCESYRWTEQGIRLNTAFERLRKEAKGASYEPGLIKAQNAWLAYRDAECGFEGEIGAGGGSAQGLYVLACKEELTRRQADRLDAATGR